MEDFAPPPETILRAGFLMASARRQITDAHSVAVGLCPFNFLRASNIDHCGGVRGGRFALPIGRSMEYRGIEYTVVRDEGGDWQWAVSLGNPETIKSGQAASKGTAILKVWQLIASTAGRAGNPD